mgnify:CR=1 FL=1
MSRRLITRVVSRLTLCVMFCAITIGAGHGAAPVAYLIYLQLRDWSRVDVDSALACLGIASIILSLAPNHRSVDIVLVILGVACQAIVLGTVYFSDYASLGFSWASVLWPLAALFVLQDAIRNTCLRPPFDVDALS